MIFQTSRKLQSIHLNSNILTTIPSSLFSNHRSLKLVDLSNNLLESLPEQLFQRTSLGIFKASDNHLAEIPVKVSSLNYSNKKLTMKNSKSRLILIISKFITLQTLNPVQSTLKHLDLSGNRISTISDSQLNQVKVKALRTLLKYFSLVIMNKFKLWEWTFYSTYANVLFRYSI